MEKLHSKYTVRYTLHITVGPNGVEGIGVKDREYLKLFRIKCMYDGVCVCTLSL